MNPDGVTGNPISLIFPRSSTNDDLLLSLSDVHQFFTKWPAPPEIFVPFLPLAHQAAGRFPIKGLQLLNNAGLGFGAAVKEGLKRSKSEFCFVLDLPLEFPLADVFQAWMEFETRSDAAIVVGSRRMPKSSNLREPSKFFWKVDNWLNERLQQTVKTGMTDYTTSFYGFRTEVVKPLIEFMRDDGFSMPARLAREARRREVEVIEKPAHWNPAQVPWSRVAKDQFSLFKYAITNF